MKFFYCLLFITAPLFYQASYADESESAHEHQVEEVIVSAAPLQRAADDLTQPTIILDKDALLLKASGSIGETLSNELGMSTTYFGPVSGRPVIRGQSGPRISVLEGGVGTLDVADLSPDHAVPIEPLFIESVEIIRGPATLLYGSSAAGGVVNIIDNRIPKKRIETPVTGSFEWRGDSAASEQSFAGQLDGSYDLFSWHVDGFSRETEDIDISGFATANEGERPDDEVEGTLLNSAGKSEGFSGGASMIFDDGFIGASLSSYENEYGLPGPEEHEGEEEEAPAIAAGPFIQLEQERIDIQGDYHFHSFIDRSSFRFGKNDYAHEEIEPSGEVGTRFENDAWEARVELEHQAIGQWRGAIGLQVSDRDFSATGEEAFIPPTTTESLGLFLLESMEWKKGILDLGLRIEDLEHSPTQGLQGYKDSALSIASGLKWNFSSRFDLSINLSHSERHPDAAELYSNGAHLATALFEVGLFANGNSSVEKETATNLDVAIHYHSAGLDWKLSTFYNDIADYIYRQETSVIEDDLPVAPYVQDDARFYGYEAEVLILLGGLDSPWNVRLFNDYVRAKTSSGDLPRIQPLRVGLQLDYNTDRWSAGMETIYHAKQDDISSFNTDSFTMLNVHGIVSLAQDSRMTWDLFAKGTNLLDEDARRSTSFRAAFVPLPGRSLHAGIRARFN